VAAIGAIDIEKSAGTEIFTNRYLVSIGPASPTSGGLIAAIVAAEKLAMYNTVAFLRARHRTIVEGDDDYFITVLTGAGARLPGANPLIPLFNVVRIDFAANFGRPSRKYLRGCLSEADLNGMNIEATTTTGVLTQYKDAILAQDEIVDPQGDTFLSGQVIPQVAMRQLRRGTRRRTLPVL